MTTEVVHDREYATTEAVRERLARRRAVDAAALVREDAARHRRRQVDAAVEKLRSRTDLSGDDCEVLTAMAEGIVDELVGEPARTLREHGDAATVDTALELFDPELESTTDHDSGAATADAEETDGN